MASEKIKDIFTSTIVVFAFFLSVSSQAWACKVIAENLCVTREANMSRINSSPQVLAAAKAYALKMKPYGMVKVTSGFRTADGQRSKIKSGVQAGPASGKFKSAHIFGTAIDLQLKGGNSLTRPTCEALISVMPMLKAGGGVIHEGCGGGSCDVHIDDNWGSRFWSNKTVMYASKGNCAQMAGLKKIGKGAFVSQADSAPLPDSAPAPVQQDPEPGAKKPPQKSASFDSPDERVQAYKRKVQSPEYQRNLAQRRATRKQQQQESVGDLIRRQLGGQ